MPDHSIVERADSNCPSTYTTASGLDFNLFCGTNQPGFDLDTSPNPQVESNIESCMDKCATIRPLCYGVAFTISNGNCWFKNNTQQSLFSPDNDTILAVPRLSELQPYDSECPFSNSSVQTADGLNYTIHCNQGQSARLHDSVH
jgi:hypothetical protein